MQAEVGLGEPSALKHSVASMFRDIVEGLSLLFAAIAAVGALLTVLLYLRQSEDESLRRLLEALIGIWKAASDIRRAANDGDPVSLGNALDEALAALPRAIALRPPVLPEIGDRLDRLYDREQALLNSDQTEEDAAEAINAIRRAPPANVWQLGRRALRPGPALPPS
jgi:hypothetical protein